MDAADVAERYRQASPDTQRIVERVLEQDADDRAWMDQLGPAYRQADVAVLLTKSKQAVSSDRRLLRLVMRSGGVGYPAFQFDGRRPLPGIAEVVEILGPVVETSWTIASWLTSPQPDLGGERPVNLLRLGDETPVIASAHRFARALAA
jgi:hypothetical protein